MSIGGRDIVQVDVFTHRLEPGELFTDLFVGGEALGELVLQGAGHGDPCAGIGRERGDEPGIDLVVLGPDAVETSEQAHFERLVAHAVYPGPVQGVQDGAFITAGGF